MTCAGCLQLLDHKTHAMVANMNIAQYVMSNEIVSQLLALIALVRDRRAVRCDGMAHSSCCLTPWGNCLTPWGNCPAARQMQPARSHGSTALQPVTQQPCAVP